MLRSTRAVKEPVLQKKPRQKVRRTNLPATCRPGCTLPSEADYGQELRTSRKVVFGKFAGPVARPVELTKPRITGANNLLVVRRPLNMVHHNPSEWSLRRQ